MYVDVAENFADDLAGSQTPDDLSLTLQRISSRMGFDYFALSLEVRQWSAGSQSVLLHDYPEEWAKVYTGFDLAGKDPVRRACGRSFVGFSWQQLEHIVPLTRGDRQMLAVGRECGINDGFTVPRHLPGLAQGTCTFAVAPDKELPLAMLTMAELAGSLALAVALNLSGISPEVSAPILSDRQRECVLWAARGKTSAETAIILGISLETVNQHLKVSRERYGVHCKQMLILKAMFDGLISFKDVVGWYSHR